MANASAIRVFICGMVGLGFTCACNSVFAQSGSALEQRIEKIMDRPEFAHARFGLEFVAAGTGDVVYALNSSQLFVPGSITKLLTEGAALELLGGDYRFHTRVYRTGPILKDGTLQGDLVLVASGDLNLSNRIQPDDTLTFEDHDHSYGGPETRGVPGDPLLVMREFARQVAAKGIKRIAGKVLVDDTLFPQGGTGTVLSSIVVNDNLVDVIASPNATENLPVQLKISPQTSYLTIINQATTGKPNSKASLKYEDDSLNPDGSRVVTLTGSLPVGGRPIMAAYPVLDPRRFAETVFVETLREQRVTTQLGAPTKAIDFKTLTAHYLPENLVAEHISPPLREEVKVTLKVSQNLHASSTPSLLGALVAHNDSESEQAGFDQENAFLRKAGLDLTGASQTDGAGGNAYFTPDFMVDYLRYMSKQKDYGDFYRALPILGREGTLANIQVNSPAAGHVHAKTGTFITYDALNQRLMVTGKALAGYMDTKSGHHLILALYVNLVSVPLDDADGTQVAGETLGEIASAAYDLL